MKPKLIASIWLCALMAATQLRVFADDSTAQLKDDAGSKSAATPPASSSKAAKSNFVRGADHVKNFFVKLPRRSPPFVVGTVIGTPVAMVRKSSSEVGVVTKGQLKKTKNPLILLAAFTEGVPAGILTGIFDGMATGPIDSWVYADKPFSKESFSLEEMK